MSMIQIIIGTALGFLVAQGALYLGGQVFGVLQRDGTRRRIGRVVPSAWIGGFTKYAALVGASAAIITLGVWAVADYMAAKSARNAVASTAFDLPATSPAADSHGPSDEVADTSVASYKSDNATATPVHDVDPYADSEFKVRRKAHGTGSSATLKEKLLQRAESKAGSELLRETRQHAQRSQYDCEAADHASRYLKAGLDVWGFAAWQAKYFPVEGYRGATLEQCKDIKEVLEPSVLDLRSAVAQGNHS